MCGRADTVFPTAQEALDLLYDGLMVEVHHNPPEAWSDAAQQLTPAAFRDMLARLVLRSESGAGASYENEMRKLRRAVDEIDDDVVDLLARRMGVVRAMGDLKRRHQVSTLQPTRFKEILASRIAAAQGKGLSEAFISQVYQMIHEEAIRVQEEPVFRGTDGPGAGASATPAE